MTDARTILIAPEEEIFDWREFETRFAALRDLDVQLARSELLKYLIGAQKNGRERIANALEQTPFASHEAVKSYSFLTDCLVRAAFQAARTVLTKEVSSGSEATLSIIAVGGYGRGEMAPFSDVDLLFLSERAIDDTSEEIIQTTLYLLWDLKLKVGHASRTIEECVKLGAEDYTIMTALLESRFIHGNQELAESFEAQLSTKLFSGSPRSFVEAKLSERDLRHAKQGQRYVVEPNVKEGKGGLRDLQSLYWIGKRIHGVSNASELVGKGLFTAEEFEAFDKAEKFLWAVRCHQHLVSRRANDLLTFDIQVAVADALGYKDQPGRRGVELFMQDYFLHATEVGDLTRIMLTKLEAVHLKSMPLLERIFKSAPKVKAGFKVVNNRLDIEDESAFLSDPVNLLRIFDEGLRTGIQLHPDAMRLVKRNLDVIDSQMRTNPEAIRIFLAMLLNRGNPERALRRMNELGVLSAFIPEFKHIVAMMQFNMYHSYTVDEHTIQCLAQLAQIERGELIEDLPVVSSILKEGVNRKVLYVALLLHDIGKGRVEDHSIIGAQIARKIAPRLRLSRSEADTVEWLVRHHLLMSDMAQKRDIADPRTVRDFVKAVKTVERLDLLCALTVCDIRGVGPDVWNNWKAVLIRALYRQTRRALEDGMEALTRENRSREAKKLLRAELSDWPKKKLSAEIKRHYEPYWQGLHVTAHIAFAHLLKDLGDGDIAIDLHPDQDRDATRALFAMTDHPGIFARLTGALALVGANIVDARSFTTKDGFVTDAFWIQDADGHPYDATRLPRLRQMIEKTLGGELIAREAMRDRDKIKKRERAFRVPTHISFDNDGSEIYTIIEVDTRDRPGLLHDLTRTLTEANLNIASAVVATYGEQVVDSFYVKDMFGLKLHSGSKQKSLEAKLREAITAGAKRADPVKS